MRKNKLLLVFLGIFLIFVSCSQKETSDSRAAGLTVSINKVWAKDFAPGQLEAHYLKHKSEFVDITREQYIANARILLNSASGSDILEKRRDDGDILRYRVSTGEFAVMTSEGRIRTYYKADYSYWQRQ